jgi:hypothetical protein
MTGGAVADTCEENGMKAVCDGPSGCKYNSDRCRVTPLSTSCGGPMQPLTKLICNGNNPNKCPKADGMFADWKYSDYSACGTVDGNYCVKGKDVMSQSNNPYYAYCVELSESNKKIKNLEKELNEANEKLVNVDKTLTEYRKKDESLEKDLSDTNIKLNKMEMTMKILHPFLGNTICYQFGRQCYKRSKGVLYRMSVTLLEFPNC